MSPSNNLWKFGKEIDSPESRQVFNKHMDLLREDISTPTPHSKSIETETLFSLSPQLTKAISSENVRPSQNGLFEAVASQLKTSSQEIDFNSSQLPPDGVPFTLRSSSRAARTSVSPPDTTPEAARASLKMESTPNINVARGSASIRDRLALLRAKGNSSAKRSTSAPRLAPVPTFSQDGLGVTSFTLDENKILPLLTKEKLEESKRMEMEWELEAKALAARKAKKEEAKRAAEKEAVEKKIAVERAAQKAVDERAAQKKAAEQEKKAAEQQAAEEKKAAVEKEAEVKKAAEEKAAEEQRIAASNARVEARRRLEREVKALDDEGQKLQRTLNKTTELCAGHNGDVLEVLQDTIKQLNVQLAIVADRHDAKFAELSAHKSDENLMQERQTVPTGNHTEQKVFQKPMKEKDSPAAHQNEDMNQSLEHQTRFSAWPSQQTRENNSPPRSVKLTGLSIKYTSNMVLSLVWGGRVEKLEHKPGDTHARVLFLRAEDAKAYHDATPNSIRVPGEERYVDVELDEHPTSTNDYVQQMIDHDVTRVVRCVGTPFEFDTGKASLEKFASADGRKVEIVRQGQTANGSQLMEFRFLRIDDSIKFKHVLLKDEMFEPCNISFGVDPCAAAKGPHLSD